MKTAPLYQVFFGGGWYGVVVGIVFGATMGQQLALGVSGGILAVAWVVREARQ